MQSYRSGHIHFSSNFTLCHTFIGQVSQPYIRQLLTQLVYISYPYILMKTLSQLIQVSLQKLFYAHSQCLDTIVDIFILDITADLHPYFSRHSIPLFPYFSCICPTVQISSAFSCSGWSLTCLQMAHAQLFIPRSFFKTFSITFPENVPKC